MSAIGRLAQHALFFALECNPHRELRQSVMEYIATLELEGEVVGTVDPTCDVLFDLRVCVDTPGRFDVWVGHDLQVVLNAALDRYGLRSPPQPLATQLAPLSGVGPVQSGTFRPYKP